MKTLRPTLTVFGLLSLITGLAYPLATTAIGQMFFPIQASGSLIRENGHIAGSELIGQSFSFPEYFWGRLSATTPMPYNAAASSGSNLALTNPALLDAVQTRIIALRKADPQNTLPIPIDLVTASGSGLDPHISPAAAYYQVSRVASARKLPVETVRALVTAHTEDRQWKFFGEPRVNVLKLNRALNQFKS